MQDQAARLRELAREHLSRGRLIAVTSGKGGVGKTNIVINLAIALAKMRERVLLLDVDLGLANVEVLLGMTAEYNLAHVLDGTRRLDEVMVEGPSGIRIVPGSSGIPKFADLSGPKRKTFIGQFEDLQLQSDFTLIDTAAGLNRNVLSFVLAADEVILVTTPEPSAIVDAYAMIKTIFQKDRSAQIQIIVNMADNPRIGQQTLQRIQEVSKQFLNCTITPLGVIPRDDHVSHAVMRTQPFYSLYPASPASRAIHEIAQRLERNGDAPVPEEARPGFLTRLAAALRVPA